MKKITSFLIFAAVTVFTAASAFAEAPDLTFEKTDGKYIYCNNHEFVRRSDLADNSNPEPKFIMTNEDMAPDKYSMFVSHVNHTELRDSNNNITQSGFDIEIDVLFRAKEDTVIEFNAAGFEVPKNGQYWYKGESYTYEDVWGCMNCWATYLQMPVRQIDSGILYEPEEFEPVSVTVKKGESFWLSRILPNYSVVPFFRPMNLMSDFEIKSGKCDINVAAFKATGTLGDRSGFMENAGFGAYDRDYQYKGVADSMNEVNASLSYTVNDDTWSGISFPVTVHNQLSPDGKEVTQWYTHLNTRADPWSGNITAESDMLDFEYRDPSKRLYYGPNVPESERDDIWRFDTRHRDTSAYDPAYGDAAADYVPNRALTSDDGTDYACNLGNYGVKVNYNLSVTNDGGRTRYFSYKLATSSNNLVYARDSEGNLIDGCAVSKGGEDSRVADYMTCVRLGPHKTTDFTITVVLTTNNPGGMQNEFVLSDTPHPVMLYEDSRQEIIKSELFTGREYYKWDNGNLYFSSGNIDDDIFTLVPLPESILGEIRGNYNEYRIYRTNDGYVMKAAVYDGIPYYTVQEFFKKVYYFDENMNYISSETFGEYPRSYVSAHGVDYVLSGSPMYSADRKEWEYAPDNVMPRWNYGPFCAKTVSGSILLSRDGLNFDRVRYQSFNGDYIDSVGNYYYYANGNDLWYSSNGVYWALYRADDRIKYLDASGGGLVVNGAYFPPENTGAVIINACGEYLGFDKKPYIINGSAYAPLRFMCESLGAGVVWNDGTITVEKDGNVITLKENAYYADVNGKTEGISSPAVNDGGTVMVPVRYIAERLGYEVEYDGEIITIK